MEITEKLVTIFREKKAGPFLFVGSGFSRRYLALEDWKGLLSKFCITGKPFEQYLASADGNYPKIAELLAKDFNDYWWRSPEFKDSVIANKEQVKHSSSALRIEICNYLITLDQLKAKSSVYTEELQLLSELNVDGVITTNWDMFLEELFPEFRVFIGQQELLFSNPQEIAEIYKIHGCSSEPDSLILTKTDYDNFNKRNPYLAAKLITIFVERPVVFVGYSLSDENIKSLLQAVASCMGNSDIEKLRQNLIFVQRLNATEKDGISDTYITVDGVQIPITLIKTDDFSKVYKAINSTKRKIPARILRYCKEQLYELVQSTEPEKKICVANIDSIESREDLEFLVGIGVAGAADPDTSNVASVGYSVLEANKLFTDLLHNTNDYDAVQILENVIPRIGRNTQNIPVFKYLREVGITNLIQYENSNYSLDKWVKRTFNDFQTPTHKKTFMKKYSDFTFDRILTECTPDNAAIYIIFLSPEKIPTAKLKDFLICHEEKLNPENYTYASNFKKLASFYDKLTYGW